MSQLNMSLGITVIQYNMYHSTAVVSVSYPQSIFNCNCPSKRNQGTLVLKSLKIILLNIKMTNFTLIYFIDTSNFKNICMIITFFATFCKDPEYFPLFE